MLKKGNYWETWLNVLSIKDHRCCKFDTGISIIESKPHLSNPHTWKSIYFFYCKPFNTPAINYNQHFRKPV